MAEREQIRITKDGPYLVSAGIPLRVETIGTNEDGDSETWVRGRSFPSEKRYHLCRCGRSRNKPFCDGSHKEAGFDGTETASREPVLEQAQVLEGPRLDLADAESLCAFGRFCDPNGGVWKQVAKSDEPAVRESFLRQVGNCPAGRLVAVDKKTGRAIEPKLEPAIGLVEDPARDCSGPLRVQGGIELVGTDGRPYEVRNRMTLCRCGRSENKPFCNGAHAAEPAFKDGLARS